MPHPRSHKKEINPIQQAMAKLNIETMAFRYTQHVFGGRPAIPRGWKVSCACLRGDQLMLTFIPYYVESSPVAREMFGVPDLIDGQILDWDVDFPEAGGMNLVQIPEHDSDAPIFIPIQEVD